MGGCCPKLPLQRERCSYKYADTGSRGCNMPLWCAPGQIATSPMLCLHTHPSMYVQVSDL